MWWVGEQDDSWGAAGRSVGGQACCLLSGLSIFVPEPVAGERRRVRLEPGGAACSPEEDRLGGFWSSQRSRLQQQRSLAGPMRKVPCGFTPAPSFASAEPYVM